MCVRGLGRRTYGVGSVELLDFDSGVVRRENLLCGCSLHRHAKRSNLAHTHTVPPPTSEEGHANQLPTGVALGVDVNHAVPQSQDSSQSRPGQGDLALGSVQRRPRHPARWSPVEHNDIVECPDPKSSDTILEFGAREVSFPVSQGRIPVGRRNSGQGFVHHSPHSIVHDPKLKKKPSDLYTRKTFGDCQLHIEWATPAKIEGKSQGRGNSGVFFADGKYEVQILDSYDNKTYADGQASALYGWKPPLVNASRKPGEWQTYDIIFEAPRFNDKGEVTKKAYVTVIHNGVVTQHRQAYLGATGHKKVAEYKPHPPKGRIKLQDHRNPMRFRNIWIRELDFSTQD